MPPAITSKLALLSASAIFGWRHIYGSRLGKSFFERLIPLNPLRPLSGGFRDCSSRSLRDVLFALLSASAIFGWRHIYGSRLGKSFFERLIPLNPLRPLSGGFRDCSSRSLRDVLFALLSASAIFGWRHIYGSRLGKANKFALLSASAYI